MAAGGSSGPTFACGYTRRKNWGVRQIMQPRVPASENKASKPLAVKICGCCAAEKLPASQENWLETPTGS